MYFLVFLTISNSDPHTLFTALIHLTNCSQRSYHHLKAVVKSAAKRVLTAPSHSFLRVSWVRVLPVSSLFTQGNRKKSAGAKSGGGCMITWNPWPPSSMYPQRQCEQAHCLSETTSSQLPSSVSSPPNLLRSE